MRGISGGLRRLNVVVGTWTVLPGDRDWLCKTGDRLHRIPLEQDD